MGVTFNPFTGELMPTTSGGAANAFQTIQPDNGTSPTASGESTLTVTSSDSSISVTGNSTTDTLDLKLGASALTASSTNTVTNKTLTGNGANATQFADSVDATKKLKVDMSGSSTGVTATIGSALTNSAQYNLPNITGTHTLTTNAVAQTLTNKTLSDSSTNFANNSDPTKLAKFSLSGMTTGKTLTIAPLVTNSQTLQIPDFGGVSNYSLVSDRNFIYQIEDFINWNATSMKLTPQITGGSSSGTDATANVPSSAHPGVWKFTSTAATDKIDFITTQNLSTVFCFGGGETIFETMVYFSALSNSTDAYTFFAGFNNGTSVLNTDYAVLQYTHTNNSGQWQGLVKTGGTLTTVNTASAVSAATWYRLTIVVNAGGTLVTFYVNGTSVGTASTNIPPDGQAHSMQVGTAWVRSAGTTSIYTIWDYVSFSQAVSR